MCVRLCMYVNLRGSWDSRFPFLAIYRAVILEVKSNVLAFLISGGEGGLYWRFLYIKFLQTFRVKFNLLKRWMSNVLRVATVRCLFGLKKKLVPTLALSESLQRCSSNEDRLCGLVVRVLGYRSRGPGSIPGTTKKKSSGSGTRSTQPREYNWGATW
jgi:hypothetical protein